MKLPGRTPILVDLPIAEYNALEKHSDESKLSMTLIIRDLIREHLMNKELVSSLSKRLIRWADETQAAEFHLSDDEYKFLTDYSGSKNISMTRLVRNLIRKFIMGLPELKEDEA
jgi:hypothetical protein